MSNKRKKATRARGSSDAKFAPAMRDKVDDAFRDLTSRGIPLRESAMARTADDYEAEIARYRAALEPFAKLSASEARDTSVISANDVSRAQLALNLGKIRRPAPTRFVSCGVRATVEGEHRIGAEVCGHMFERVEVHVTQDDIRSPAFVPWLVSVRNLRQPAVVHVYPNSGTDGALYAKASARYEHTTGESRVRAAISNMPGGGAYSELNSAGSFVGMRDRQPARVDPEDVGMYLEVLASIRREELAEHDAVRKRLAAVESDLAAVARVFGGAKTAADHEVPE